MYLLFVSGGAPWWRLTQLAGRDQPAAPAPDDPQLAHHVLLEEVDTDPERRCGLGLRDERCCQTRSLPRRRP